MTISSSLALIDPSPSLSNTSNACFSSSTSFTACFFIIDWNSSKSISPSPGGEIKAMGHSSKRGRSATSQKVEPMTRGKAPQPFHPAIRFEFHNCAKPPSREHRSHSGWVPPPPNVKGGCDRRGDRRTWAKSLDPAAQSSQLLFFHDSSGHYRTPHVLVSLCSYR